MEGTAQTLSTLGVLVVGVGGLGCQAALELARAGCGRVGLMDPDRVELSNLHRQILHRTSDLGRSKVSSAAAKLRAVAPRVKIDEIAERLTDDNFLEVTRPYDFLIDASDNFETKFMINDMAVASGKPYSHGAAIRLLGQTLTVLPGQSACYRCLFTAPPNESDIPSCQEAGILGPVAAAIGAIQAIEAIKWHLGSKELLTNRLLTYDASRQKWRLVDFPKNPSCPACGGAKG